jgi:hypothetical protein
MPTPLFPDDSEHITLRQGGTGDCYLLAAIDCITNLDPEGRAQFKSMFTQTEDGVIVRIKRTAISDNLKPYMLIGKYGYKYNHEKREDEFFISNERLEIIDAADSIGVKTNSLAVKILEHLSAYYLAKPWDHRDLNASIKAHSSASKNEVRHSVHETAFVGQLLGVESHRVYAIDCIIKLKTLSPDFPVYVAMDWGGSIYGTTHPRHALRVKSITPKRGDPTDFDFVLVNPWDNTRTETHSLQEIRERDPYFSIFSSTVEKIDMGKLLLQLPQVDGRYLVSEPDLHPLVQEAKKNILLFNSQDVQRLIRLHRDMPSIVSLYELLTKTEQKKFFTSLSQSQGKKNSFLSIFIDQMDRIEVLREVIRDGIPVESRSKIFELCIQTKDKKLFARIDHMNLFRHFMYSALDKETFLKNLIELETGVAPPDGKRLKAIAEYIEAYNTVNPSATLNAQVPESFIANVVFTREESVAAKARITILQVIDAIKEHPIDFTAAKTLKDVEDLHQKLAAEIRALHTESVSGALQLLDPIDADEVQLGINEKVYVVQLAAERQSQYIKYLEDTIAKYVSLIDFPMPFSKAYDERSVQNMVQLFERRLENIAANEELMRAQAALGMKIHPTIADALKIKKEELEVCAQNRLDELKYAADVIENSIRTIQEFSPVFTGLYTIRDCNVALSKHLRALDALLHAPALEEAHRKLGLAANQNMTLISTFDKKRRAIEADVKSKLAGIAEAENKVPYYLNKLKTIFIDYSNANSETAIRNCIASLLGKMSILRDEVQNDRGLDLIPAVKDELITTINAHESAALKEGITAHNRLMYLQLESALDNSGFKEAWKHLVFKIEASQDRAKFNQKFQPYAKISLEMKQAITAAKEELMSIPTDVKLSSVKAKQKLEVFKSKVQAATSKANHTLGADRSWAERFNALEHSTRQLEHNFTAAAPIKPTENRNSIFTNSPSRRTSIRNPRIPVLSPYASG